MSNPLQDQILHSLTRLQTGNHNFSFVRDQNATASADLFRLRDVLQQLLNQRSNFEEHIERIQKCQSAWASLLTKVTASERPSENLIYTQFSSDNNIKQRLQDAESKLDSLVLSQNTLQQMERDLMPSATPTMSGTLKLPTLELKPFNGNRLNWAEFWDSFSAAVDSNNMAAN